MKVFISWSGQRSKETAEILSSWIRQVIQSAETWISLDIEKGARWNDKISKELEQTKIGIICLNKENLSSEWILFEAGALSKTNDAHVCTFLLDIVPSDVKPPLGQFQHTSFLKEDVKKLMHTINNKIILNGEKTILEKDLDEILEIFWPRLESKLMELQKKASAVLDIKRNERDILEEILQIVRSMNKPSDLSKDLLLLYLWSDKNESTKQGKFRNYIAHSDLGSTFYKNMDPKYLYDLITLLKLDEKKSDKKDDENKKDDNNDDTRKDDNGDTK